MAKIAEQYADQVIVSDDNPRHENPEQITTEIMQGFANPEKIILVHDRSKAIQNAIQSDLDISIAKYMQHYGKAI